MNDDIYIVRDMKNFASITDLLQKSKFNFSNVVLKQGILEANYRVSRQLGLELGSKVFFIKRLRIVEGQARSIETDYIDYKLVPGIEKHDFSNISFYEWIAQEYGYHTIRSDEEILVVEASDEECELLNFPKESEVLLVKGTTYKDTKGPFEYFELVCDPSFYRFRSVSKR